MRRTLPFVLLLPIVSLPAQAPRAEVPVRTVMLFSSGVGYFEHAGTVQGNGTTELRFTAAQINDILKSLVLQDLDGGTVSTINYPSQDPVNKTLRSFQVDITANPSMAALANQLRGARVSVQVAGERISGTILGVEVRTRATERGETVEVLNLISGAMIRSVELPAVTSLTLEEADLQEELTKALSVLSTARGQDKKPVTIAFTGSGSRRVRVGYVVETPVWKTSYRLLLGDRVTTLQGWAIVENQTESDWRNVDLSLVSGRPISFVMDLYQPLYLARPTVVPELFASLRPRAYEGGVSGEMARTAMAPPPAATAAAGRGGAGGRGGVGVAGGSPLAGVIGEPPRQAARLDLGAIAGSADAAGTAGALGELFQYSIGNVNLPRQTSAMLPIVTDSVSVDRLSIYNAAVLASNPLTGVRLKNVTGKHLLQGPVTVLDKGGYAGDAQIDNIPPGQSRLLAYGIDLDLTVKANSASQPTAVTAAKVAKGMLVLSRRYVSSREYEVTNKGTRDRTILIEHPSRADWKLVDTPKPVETTSALYRFEGNAVAGKVTTLTVKEENVREETMAMLQGDLGALLTYSKTGEIAKDVRDAIGRAVQLRQAVLDTERDIATKSAQIAETTQEQDRIRENMKTVGQNTDYYQRLLAKLNEQESLIEKTQSERDTLYGKLDTQRRALESYLSDLTIG